MSYKNLMELYSQESNLAARNHPPGTKIINRSLGEGGEGWKRMSGCQDLWSNSHQGNLSSCMPTFDPRDFYYTLKAWDKFPLSMPMSSTRNWGHDSVEGWVLSLFFPLSWQLADLRAAGQHSEVKGRSGNGPELGPWFLSKWKAHIFQDSTPTGTV